MPKFRINCSAVSPTVAYLYKIAVHINGS